MIDKVESNCVEECSHSLKNAPLGFQNSQSFKGF